MSKKHKKQTRHRNCETCPHCIYIGEGDFVCTKCSPFIVKEDFLPNEYYNACQNEITFKEAQKLSDTEE